MGASATDWSAVYDDDDADGGVWWLTNGKRDIGKIFAADDARVAAKAPAVLAALVAVSDWMANHPDISHDDPMLRFVLRVVADAKGYSSSIV